ncbi:hypothetical protein [Herbidospora cretacea]|uniref:hypothetical protein n=1 Tax=Herbidospora cretacea TaxID=28444 RepID=UPI00077426E7|nr:hypothetical protein [Herbidospora cretacea]
MGSRVMQLRYPTAVGWGESVNQPIGSGADFVDAGRDVDKVGILDLRTPLLPPLNAGTVAVSVTNDATRAHTGGTPIPTSTTIEVVR